MTSQEAFVDIHCHLLPALDDGAKSWDESLGMAKIAVAGGIRTVIATPHQLGNYARNDGDIVRRRTRALQERLCRKGIALNVLPGADVRIDDGMFDKLRRSEVLTLGDHGQHVLLELPHELYFPLDPVVRQLSRMGIVAILSHPERNQGLLAQRSRISELVAGGCLMQITAGSLLGAFGAGCQQFAEWMLGEGCVHFIATDAHGVSWRRPRMRRSHLRVVELVGREVADVLCCRNPLRVAKGQVVTPGRGSQPRRTRRWFGWNRSA